MTNYEINKLKTCAVSGHRIMSSNFDEKKLYDVFYELINAKIDTFLVGMALGFDSVCFKVLQNIKKSYPIKIIACVPCLDQEKSFSLKSKNDYYNMINSADIVINVSEEYFVGCMQKRNRFMCDNASYLVAYILRENGGTYSTVKYAQKKGLNIIKIN